MTHILKVSCGNMVDGLILNNLNTLYEDGLYDVGQWCVLCFYQDTVFTKDCGRISRLEVK